HDADLIIPLPLHRKRERERGFNQSALLARELASLLGLTLAEDAMSRPVYRRPQVGLGFHERRANVDGVFRVDRPERVAGRAVLLIDDVLTTGATCREGARELRKSGADSVQVLTLAREA